MMTFVLLDHEGKEIKRRDMGPLDYEIVHGVGLEHEREEGAGSVTITVRPKKTETMQ